MRPFAKRSLESIMRRRFLAALAFALLPVSSACGREPVEEAPWRSPIPFDTAVAWMHSDSDSTRLLIELAESDSQHQFGLMTRPTLDAESGMAFLYDSVQTGENGFWMFRTRVPLDIAFVDSANVIRAILQMEPCESPNPQQCPVYEPKVDYLMAIEANKGWFGRHGVEVGTRVNIDKEAAATAPTTTP